LTAARSRPRSFQTTFLTIKYEPYAPSPIAISLRALIATRANRSGTTPPSARVPTQGLGPPIRQELEHGLLANMTLPVIGWLEVRIDGGDPTTLGTWQHGERHDGRAGDTGQGDDSRRHHGELAAELDWARPSRRSRPVVAEHEQRRSAVKDSQRLQRQSARVRNAQTRGIPHVLDGPCQPVVGDDDSRRNRKDSRRQRCRNLPATHMDSHEHHTATPRCGFDHVLAALDDRGSQELVGPADGPQQIRRAPRLVDDFTAHKQAHHPRRCRLVNGVGEIRGQDAALRRSQCPFEVATDDGETMREPCRDP
jgi:hypothetical protein